MRSVILDLFRSVTPGFVREEDVLEAKIEEGRGIVCDTHSRALMEGGPCEVHPYSLGSDSASMLYDTAFFTSFLLRDARLLLELDLE